MQVDPIKPTLKAPGTKRAKLKCDKPLSNFAFKLKLRRYDKVLEIVVGFDLLGDKVGRCRLTLSKPVLKAPGTKRLKV
jgi:hypothetical protein